MSAVNPPRKPGNTQLRMCDRCASGIGEAVRLKARLDEVRVRLRQYQELVSEYEELFLRGGIGVLELP